MKTIKVILYLIFTSVVLQINAQNQNYIYRMDSLHVINNACATRIVNGQLQYVMMPTLYNTTVANGMVNFVIINASSLQMTQKYSYTPFLRGAVINDIRIAPNGEILFAGTQNGHGIHGELLSSGHLKKVRYDTAFIEIAAMTYLPLANNEQILFCGINSANKSIHGRLTLSSNTRDYRITDVTSTNKKVKDIAYYKGGTQALKCGGVILRYNSSTQVDIITYNASTIGTSSQSRTLNIPTGWQWHEGGGAIAQISDMGFVAAIDVRNPVTEIDGIFFIKFNVNSFGKVSVYETHIITMPSPKVVVKDIVYIDNPDYEDVSYNVVGQYITNNLGTPFLLKTDTSFLNYSALKYVDFLSQAEYCNFRLNKIVCNDYDEQYPLIAVGAFDAYASVYPSGGIYITRNMPGDYWYYFTNCEATISLNSQGGSISSGILSLTGAGTYNSLLPSDSSNFVTLTSNTIEQLICGKGNWVAEEKKLETLNTNDLNCHIQGDKIVLKNTDNGSVFEIFNSIGERVLYGQASKEINISSLKNGWYILRLINKGANICTEKFVKQ